MAWKSLRKEECPHLAGLGEEWRSDKAACEACGDPRDLRICLSCGYVGCCESHGAHNTEHYRNTRHPIIRPQRAGYDWLWCYECNAFLT